MVFLLRDVHMFTFLIDEDMSAMFTSDFKQYAHHLHQIHIVCWSKPKNMLHFYCASHSRESYRRHHESHCSCNRLSFSVVSLQTKMPPLNFVRRFSFSFATKKTHINPLINVPFSLRYRLFDFSIGFYFCARHFRCSMYHIQLPSSGDMSVDFDMNASLGSHNKRLISLQRNWKSAYSINIFGIFKYSRQVRTLCPNELFLMYRPDSHFA